MEEILDRKIIRNKIEKILWKLVTYYTKKEIQTRANLNPDFIWQHIGRTGTGGVKEIKIKTGIKLGEHDYLFEELIKLVALRKRIMKGELKTKKIDDRDRDKPAYIPKGMSNIDFLCERHKGSFATKAWR